MKKETVSKLNGRRGVFSVEDTSFMSFEKVKKKDYSYNRNMIKTALSGNLGMEGLINWKNSSQRDHVYVLSSSVSNRIPY